MMIASDKKVKDHPLRIEILIEEGEFDEKLSTEEIIYNLPYREKLAKKLAATYGFKNIKKLRISKIM